VLGSLACENPTVQDTIREAGAIPPLVALLHGGAESGAAESAAETLNVLATSPTILESVLRHVGVCGIGSFVILRLFWNRSCGILGFAALDLLSSSAYFGIGPAAFWGLWHWIFCHPPPILESVLRHVGVCGIGSFVILRLFWNRSCGILGFAALGLLSSSAYFGIGPAA